MTVEFKIPVFTSVCTVLSAQIKTSFIEAVVVDILLKLVSNPYLLEQQGSVFIFQQP